MRKLTAKIAVLVMACVMLCACGKATLETMFNSAAGKQQIEEMKSTIMDSFDGYYSDFDMVAEGNNITYMYYLSEDMDELADTLSENLETSTDWESEIENVKNDIESSSKIRPETITYSYYTSTGDLIFTVTK